MENEKPIQLSRRNSVEMNKKIKEKAVWGSPEMSAFREKIMREHGADMRDTKVFPNASVDFNWGKFGKKCMRETNTSSGNAQLLRAGVQAAVNNLYTAVETTWEQWAHAITSKMDTELYAPLNAMSFLSEIGAGEKYPESNVVGLDIKLRNKKLGQMLPVQMELLDDDQTGQFAQKVGEMADYAALAWEVYAYGKLSSTGLTNYGGLKVPASETKPVYESSYPYSSTGLRGGGINKFGTFQALSQSSLQSAFTAQEEILNLQGLKMNLSTSHILIGPYYRWVLATLLNSNFYPSGAAAAGAVGGSLATNVLKGIAEPVISKFMFDNTGSSANSKAWYVCDASKPAFIVQLRETSSVTQENPESGAGFDRDIYRWKLRLRGNADFIDPRFFFQGSDGSV